MKNLWKAALLALTLVNLSFECKGEYVARPDGAPLNVVVSIPPLEWVARELTPDASVTVLARPGSSPHAMELTPGQVVAIAKADIVLAVGFQMELPLEAAMRAHSRTGRDFVTFESVLGDHALAEACDHEHHEGEAHEHHHHGPSDPHMWLDPTLMAEYAGFVADKMKARVEAESAKAEIDARLADLQAACREIDEEYGSRLAGVARNSIVTHHNAYAYLAQRYGLTVAAVIKPFHGAEPTPGDLQAAATAIRREGVRSIFVEPQFSARAAERLAEMTGANVLELDPLGDGDYPAIMRANLDALVEGLGGE